MATTQQLPDPIDSVNSMEPSTLNTENNTVTVENLSEQPPSTIEEKVITDASHKINKKDLLREAPGQLGSENAEGNQTTVYVSNIYSPQAQTVFYGGYDNWPGEWDEYPRFEGLEVGSTGIFNENPSLIYSSGYGFGPQMPYGPYSPATTPLPSVSGDGQLFGPQQFPFSGTYFQQPTPSSLPYMSSSAQIPQSDLQAPVNQQGAFFTDTSSTNGMLVGPRPGYQLTFGSADRDWMKSTDATGSSTPLLSPAASPQPILFGQNNMQLSSGMAQQNHRPFYGFGSSVTSFDRGYPYSGLYPGSTSGVPFTNFGTIERNSNTIDKNRKRGKGNDSFCSCNGSLDFLNEQNRGPRANKSKNQTKERNAAKDDKHDSSSSTVDHTLYNSPDFITEYKDAKFFIIKSYSEDNVHKSIKYGVWASTSNGNRKLDSAYRETKEKNEHCPIFLFFSVNASAQFCGVAEMIGPVDFEKSVDYWQQDKWSGQFPVKWHIVKDVPNNLFRHIILESNDNKPVTNSRDTQEVKLEQGLEMLSILRKHEYEASILDDFDFYEEREKALQERKARQQQLLSNSIVALAGEQRHLGAISGDMVNQMTKSFADAVRLDEKSKVDSSTDKSGSPTTEEIKKPATASVTRSS